MLYEIVVECEAYLLPAFKCFRNSEGDTPQCFLNILLKYKGLLYKTISAIYVTLYGVDSSKFCALEIRRERIYCVGVEPV